MAGEGGKRPYWRFVQNVNVSNGNLHLELGSGSCVTCGGTPAGSPYLSPQNTKLTGPILIYNGLQTTSTSLGVRWMTPYDAYLNFFTETDVELIDVDGTRRVYANSTETEYVSQKDADYLIEFDETDYILHRHNGDKWYFHGSGTSQFKLKKIVSRTTHEITVTRDGSARVTTVTDGQGRETKFLYITTEGETRLSEIREPAPGDIGFFSTYFAYDGSARLASITNPMGEVMRFEYDGSSRLQFAYDGHGHATEYTYDGSSRVTNVEDPNGESTVIVYTSSTVRTITNRIGEDTIFTIDGSGRTTKVKDALDNENEWEYNSTSWEVSAHYGPKIPVSGTPWSRHKEVFAYGSTDATRHNLLDLELYEVTNSSTIKLAAENWTYNSFNDLLTYSDRNGLVTTYTYKLDGGSNSVGLVLTIVNDLSQTVETNTYDSSGAKYRLLTFTNGVSKTWTYAYNQNTANSYGTPDKITTPISAVTNRKVDIRGRVYEVTDPSGNLVKFDFDSLDRQIRTIYPDGTTSGSVYDCCHLMATYDQNGFGDTMEYDVLGRVTKVENANGETTEYGYNEEGWRTSVTDAKGNVTTTDYDEIGRPIEIDYPGVWLETLTYWEPGMLKSKTNYDGTTSTTVNYEYNDLYQLIKKNYPSGTDTEFEWDLGSRMTKMTDASGEKRYTWDDANRLLKILQGPAGFVENTNHNYKVEYQWNAASQKTECKLTVRTLSAKTWTYTYTDDNQLKEVVNPDSETTLHEYLSDGRLKKITLRKTGGGNGPTRETFYEDTDASHGYVSSKCKWLRKTLDKKSGGAVIDSYTYSLDKGGRNLGVEREDDKYTFYGLDPLANVKAENQWDSKTGTSRQYQFLFAMDSNSNRLTKFEDGDLIAYTYGSANQILTASSDSFTFDNFMNMKTKVSGGSTTTYGWDFESNLISIDYPSTANDDSHEYDGESRRMRSKLNGASNWTNFVWDEVAGTLLAEYTLISSTYLIKSENTWGLGLISTNRESTKRYFHFDGTGNSIALTDGSENITDTYGYTAAGESVSAEDSGTSVNPFRWMGESGAYDDGARGSFSGLVRIRMAYFSTKLGESIEGPPMQMTRSMKIDPVYGNHCGPQTNEGPDWSVDAMDECCRLHDKCFKKYGCNIWNQYTSGDCMACTRALCSCLDNIDCSTTPWRKKECAYWLPIFKLYACGVRLEESYVA